MRKMLAVAALAGLTIVSSMIATTGQADARGWRWGPAIGLGVAGAFVAGAVIANSGPYRALRLAPSVRSPRQLHGPRLGLQLLLSSFPRKRIVLLD